MGLVLSPSCFDSFALVKHVLAIRLRQRIPANIKISEATITWRVKHKGNKGRIRKTPHKPAPGTEPRTRMTMTARKLAGCSAPSGHTISGLQGRGLIDLTYNNTPYDNVRCVARTGFLNVNDNQGKYWLPPDLAEMSPRTSFSLCRVRTVATSRTQLPYRGAFWTVQSRLAPRSETFIRALNRNSIAFNDRYPHRLPSALLHWGFRTWCRLHCCNRSLAREQRMCIGSPPIAQTRTES